MEEKFKTIRDSKDAVAKAYSFDSWATVEMMFEKNKFTVSELNELIDQAMLLYRESQIENDLFSENEVHHAISMARGITIRPNGTHHYHSDNLQIVEHIKAIKKLKS